MKGLNALKIRLSFGDAWQSPPLHVLLTEEDSVIVARCLDFRVSSHGEDQNEAIQSLLEALKEYFLTAVEEDAMDLIQDPAQNRYWRLFNEIEINHQRNTLRQSIASALKTMSVDQINNVSSEIVYA